MIFMWTKTHVIQNDTEIQIGNYKEWRLLCVNYACFCSKAEFRLVVFQLDTANIYSV